MTTTSPAPQLPQLGATPVTAQLRAAFTAATMLLVEHAVQYRGHLLVMSSQQRAAWVVQQLAAANLSAPPEDPEQPSPHGRMGD